MAAPERLLDSEAAVKALIHSVLDWSFVGVDDIAKSSKNRTFFMSKGL